MVETVTLQSGIVLRCFPDKRFKQGSLSIQFVRPMGQEASYNALLPAVLLRGTKQRPDMRHIIHKLDDLYGASVGALVRRVGDYHTTGLSCSFIDDRFAMPPDTVLQPMIDFLRELLREPLVEDQAFRADYVSSEKENLILTIEAQRNDKRAYAASQLLKYMCREDSFGLPRLGDPKIIEKITPRQLYQHYEKVLKESPIEIFYTGSMPADRMAEMLMPLFAGLERTPMQLPAQTAFQGVEGGEHTEQMEVTQGKLAMGFVTPITHRDPRFVPMQVLNTVYGSGMISKLFMKVREELSLCYDINSGYYGTKGIMTVCAGIDPREEEVVREQILKQLDACVKGEITPQELQAAKESVISGLKAVHDSPGSIEGYYAVSALSGLGMTPEEYICRTQEVTVAQVAEAAGTLKLHTVYFLRGVD